jgi:hypothetical protein
MKAKTRVRSGLSLSISIPLLLTGAIASLAQISPTGFWVLPVNLSNVAGRSFQTTVARDPSTGDLFVAWTEDGVAAREEIMLRRWDQDTQRWQAAVNLSQSQDWERDGGPALVFDGQGHGLLIWTRTYSVSEGAPADGHDVLWRSWNGETWSPEMNLMHDVAYLPGSPGAFDLIPVETPDGILLFIVWGTTYRTTEYQDGAWSELSPWVTLDVSLAQVIRDASGTLHAAAYGENSAQWGYNAYFWDAYYLTYDGLNWSVPINLSSTDGVADNVGMAFDESGRLHFLWSDPCSKYSDESLESAIWERIYDGGTWSPNTRVTMYDPNQAINGFSLAADISGTLHLAWSEGIWVNGIHTDLKIYYRTGDGITWGPEEPVYTSPVDNRYPLIGVGDDGPFLTWREVFWAGGPLYDQEVYFSRRTSASHYFRTYLPLVKK